MRKPILLVAIAALVIIGWSSLPRAEEKSAIKPFEYMVVTNKVGTIDTAKALTALLMANAKEGWEFCDCVATEENDLLVFKRPK